MPNPTRMHTYYRLFLFRLLSPILLCLWGVWGLSMAEEIKLAWDPVSDTDLAGYKVYYGTAPGVYTAFKDAGKQTTLTITGLLPGTYYFVVKAYNGQGVESMPSNEVVGEVQVADSTAPTIGNVTAVNLTPTSVQIAWTTNEAADSQVDFGLTASYGTTTELHTAKTTSHSVLLTGLFGGTVYHYRVKSEDAAGNLAVSNDFAFSTSVIPAPSTYPPTTVTSSSSSSSTHLPSTTTSSSSSSSSSTLASTSTSTTIKAPSTSTTSTTLAKAKDLTLTASLTALSVGQAVTLTLENGPGGRTDWISFSPVGSTLTSSGYHTWFYLNGLRTAPTAGLSNVTLSVTPTAVGTYEFRLFSANSYTLLARSQQVLVSSVGVGITTTTVSPTTTTTLALGGNLTLTPSLTTVAGGQPVSVMLANGPGHRTDWISFSPVGSTLTSSGYHTWFYLNGLRTAPAAGLSNVTLPVTPTAAGTYEFRLFSANSYTLLARSGQVIVSSAAIGNTTTTVSPVTTTTLAPTGNLTLTPSVSAIAMGQTVNVTLANGPGGRTDWISFSPVGSTLTSSGYHTWFYLNGLRTAPAVGLSNATLPVTPTAVGTYEFRLFSANSYNLLIRSGQITVSAVMAGSTTTTTLAPAKTLALTPSLTTVAVGQALTVTVANGPGNTTDWISFSPVGTSLSLSGYHTWFYLNGLRKAPTTGSVNVTLPPIIPTTPGTYEFRLFYRNSYTLLVRSRTVTVTGTVTSGKGEKSGLDVGLLAAYPFDEGSGTEARDSSGNSRHGLLHGVEWTNQARFGAALSFRSKKGYVSLPADGLPAAHAPKSVSYWVYSDSKSNDTQSILSLRNEDRGISLQSGLRASFFGVWKEERTAWLVLGTYPYGRNWQHVVYTYDGTIHRLYLNGKEVGSSTIRPPEGAIHIFELGRNGLKGNYFQGSLDELRIYDRVLNEQEIQSLLSGPGVMPSSSDKE